MEDREERRRDYDVKLDVLSERVENWMETTTDYRKALCGKLDLITQRLNELPCKGREAETKAIKTDVERLQLAAWVVIMALFGMGVAWGTVSNRVTVNTDKWKVLEPEHQDLIRDVEVLKETSYGYRGIPLK